MEMSASVTNLGAGDLLKDLHAALSAIEKLNLPRAEPAIRGLVERLGDLIDIVGSFDSLATKERRHPSVHLNIRSANALLHLQSVLSSTEAINEECSLFIQPLPSAIQAIAHEWDVAGCITTESRLEHQTWYHETSQALAVLAEALRASFTAIDLLQYQHIADEDTSSLKATQLHFQIGLIEKRLHLSDHFDSDTVRAAIEATRAITIHIPPVPNQHFHIPRRLTPYFTGRGPQLAELERAFQDPTKPSQQRFVIYGLSGAGKTELACKFAEACRQNFWGVFSVIGSSPKDASDSYAQIAFLAGVEPNERAVKNWLSTRALPWLLILDNVDDDEIDIEQLLPEGPTGCILITTRNLAHRTYGNAGARYLELPIMQPDEAQELIITAAEEPKPWSVVVLDSAQSICQALGFLPLALDQAAKAILHRICEWTGYLAYFDRQFERIRRTRKSFQDNNSLKVFSTYEILYESLESSSNETYHDAIELLHIFSYFHFDNIRLDVLVNSATNPLKEQEQQSEDAIQEGGVLKKLVNPRRKPWKMFLREIRAELNWRLATLVPMPKVLRNQDRLSLQALEGEVEDRLRTALSVLTQRSLVMRQDRSTDGYSMHPLVHKWVRERPKMTTSYQALWCEISITALAWSIRRPPHGDTEEEARVRRELLPHIRHVRECQAVIVRRLQENVARANRPVWRAKPHYGRPEIEQDVRFSRVYAETGNFTEARALQERALSFVSRRLGLDHPAAIMLSLFLSKTMWEMSEIDEATQRQRQAYQLCVSTWGDDHPLTLDISESLGSALYLKGRWAEASTLHEGNMKKYQALYGEKHEKTLKAVRNYARLLFRRMEYEEATRLHQRVWEGMRETLGETHLETLTSQEDLAMSYLRFEYEDPDPSHEKTLTKSHEDMAFVYEQRSKLLGKEHPYVLLASLFFARLKSALGRHEEAEKMISTGLEVAERNLGKEHIGVLMAKAIYADILTKLKRFAEAESIFYNLIDKSWYSRLADEDGDHPDRLSYLYFLAKCLEEQGKYEEALKISEDFLAGLGSIGGKGAGMRHKVRELGEKRVERLRGKMKSLPGDNLIEI
ncbi:hypothetical protein BDV96DRAFT_317649 [Lophiotrema nucula]|uniref:AAA+ ATPase domain-containing protein n=1 Tax=Lophiotrema nucula TaxID=690887 RepID=A0A6A5ZL72_9PLEO|nr:hypothetical protein BDV96DRAFT_317649 [Lophiotrema nucula]